MLGTSSASSPGGGLIGGNNSAEAAAVGATTTAAAGAAEATGGAHSGGSGDIVGGGASGAGFSEDEKARIEESERGGGGNRWPRQETLALLKIRSDMDVTFRDSSLKGPLWEEVSRKMAELGYQRSSKKCKEKFENVFKYHKRTKDGRASKADGKTYRFFDQLEALEAHPSMQLSAPPPPTRPQLPPMAAAAATMTAAVPMQTTPAPPISSHGTVSSAPLSPNPVSFAQNFSHQNVTSNVNIPTIPSLPPSQSQQMPLPPPPPTTTNASIHHHHPSNISFPHHHHPNLSTSMLSNSSSSSTSSDEDIGRRHLRKRKWKDFFERLMKNVIDKQEELQKKFLDTLEKRERDRMIREEAWRVQEMSRMNREHDLLVQERSMAAAKDAAVIAFLQKITEQQNQQNPNSTNATTTPPIQLPVQLQFPETNPIPQSAPPPTSTVPLSISVSIPQATPIQPILPPAAASVAPQPPTQATTAAAATPLRNVESSSKKTDNGIQNFMQPSPSRWPKTEVQALIQLRTNLDTKYQENGPKGPLWEEISAQMRKLGYNRNAKRCKEKWENINKYFKKVKESNKKRPEDSKTCPYFHQLDALYREKGTTTGDQPTPTSFARAAKQENNNPMAVPIMARPEQQWPLQQQDQQQQHQDAAMEDHGSDNMDENDHDEDMDDGDEDDDDDEGAGYEIVTNKQASSAATTVQ